MADFNSSDVYLSITGAIDDWHENHYELQPDRVIVTDEIRKIRKFNEHRSNIMEVVKELTVTNTEIWHEEDKVRSENDEIVLKAIRNINPLNQHRNDLIEEIDEIIAELVRK